MNNNECRSCINRVGMGIAYAIDDVLSKEDIHIGNESHAYKVERADGITTVTFSFVEADPGEHKPRKGARDA